MSNEEIKQIKIEYYNEAIRYMDNAKQLLKKSGKKDSHYLDDKYVKIATGTAYNAILKALDGYILLLNIKKPKGRKSIEYYRDALKERDNKLKNLLNEAYSVLHLTGYYDGVTYVKIIDGGFDLAYSIIEKIKP